VRLGFDATADLPLGRQPVGGPDIDGPRRRVARRLADETAVGGGDRTGGGIDVLGHFKDARIHQGKPGEDFPTIADSAGHFEFEAVGAPFFGQDRRRRFEVAIALPILGCAIERGTHGKVAFHKQPLCADLQHVAAFRRLCPHRQLVEVGRGAERVAPADVVMRVLGGMEGKGGANAVFAEAQLG